MEKGIKRGKGSKYKWYIREEQGGLSNDGRG